MRSCASRILPDGSGVLEGTEGRPLAQLRLLRAVGDLKVTLVRGARVGKALGPLVPRAEFACPGRRAALLRVLGAAGTQGVGKEGRQRRVGRGAGLWREGVGVVGGLRAVAGLNVHLKIALAVGAVRAVRALVRLLPRVDLKVPVQEVVPLGALELPPAHRALHGGPRRRASAVAAALGADSLWPLWPLWARTHATASLRTSCSSLRPPANPVPARAAPAHRITAQPLYLAPAAAKLTVRSLREN